MERSRAVGISAGLAGLALVAGPFLPVRDRTESATVALALVLPVVGAAWLGGRVAALVTAVAATITLNLGFLPPYGSFTVDLVEEAVALAAFAAVALATGTLVALAAERLALAERRAQELRAREAESDELRAEQDQLAAEKRALEILGDQRQALLRSVSHDLRTPLAAIRAVVTDLREGTEYDAATQAELLDIVSDEADRLDRLVANLLSLSRIEAGALVPDRQAVPLDELLTDRVRKLNRMLRDVRLQVDVPFTLPLADADYDLLDQVVTNLLENAARHSPTGGTVRVRARERVGWLEVSVSDQGRGIPVDTYDRIFEPFTTGAGSRSTGIGLAICRAIVEAHGGSIAASQADGGGAQLTFTVPVHRT